MESGFVPFNVELIHVVPGEIQKLVLVLPTQRLCFELLGLCWRWRRFRNFGNQVCRRCLREAVDEHANKWDLNEDVEA